MSIVYRESKGATRVIVEEWRSTAPTWCAMQRYCVTVFVDHQIVDSFEGTVINGAFNVFITASEAIRAAIARLDESTQQIPGVTTATLREEQEELKNEEPYAYG